MKYNFFIIVILILNGCIHYTDYRPQNITSIESNLSAKYIFNYYDSVENSTWNNPKKEWTFIANSATNKELYQLVYYFPPPKEEMYVVGCISPIVIVGMYNDLQSDWINGDNISLVESKRIKKRFETEVVRGMEIYGKSKNIPDSLIYIQYHNFSKEN